jgi:hypothetical protein
MKTFYIQEFDVRVKVFEAMDRKNAVSWDVTPCGSSRCRRFEGNYHFHYQGNTNRRARNNDSIKYLTKHVEKKYKYKSTILVYTILYFLYSTLYYTTLYYIIVLQHPSVASY